MKQRTRRRLPRIVAIVVALVLAIIVGTSCADDDTAIVLDLPAALLTPDDLGDGWSVSTADPEGEPLDGSVPQDRQQELPRPELCEEASAEAREAIEGLEWQAFRSLELEVADSIRPPLDRSGHLVFLHQLLTIDRPDEQQRTFELLRQGFEACLGDIPAGEEGPGRAEPLAVPTLGDDRFGVLVTIEEAGAWAEWRIAEVMVLEGPVIMALLIGNIRSVDVQPYFSTEALNALIDTAYQRLRSRTSP